MFETDLGTFSLFALTLLALGCTIRSVTRWQSGLHLLIVGVLFGGIASDVLADGAAAIAFRDLFIVLPMYLGFFFGRDGASALARTPLDLMMAMVVVAAYVALMAFNPVDATILQLLIGLKVWLLYLPFLFIGIALASQTAGLFRTMRFFLLIGLMPPAIGLVQALLVRVIGYHAAITLFFGSAAESATQGFGYYENAGGLYRIPSTFSFVGQYVEYLYLYLTIVVIESKADPEPRFRRIAEFALFATLIAGIFSGTRGALVTFPGLIAAYACFGLISRRVLIATPIALGVGYFITSRADIDLYSLFNYGWNLTDYYAHTFIFQQISDGLHNGGLFGAGIGSSTGAARYATTGFVAGLPSVFGYESYFAKIAVELGSIGLDFYAMFLILVALRGITPAFKYISTPLNQIIAPFAIYIAFNLGMSFKGYVLDTDPANIFFWIALGVIVQISRSGLHWSPMTSELDALRVATTIPKIPNVYPKA